MLSSQILLAVLADEIIALFYAIVWKVSMVKHEEINESQGHWECLMVKHVYSLYSKLVAIIIIKGLKGYPILPENYKAAEMQSKNVVWYFVSFYLPKHLSLYKSVCVQ